MQLTDDQREEILSIYHAMRAKIQQPDFIYKREVLDGYMQVFYYCMCQAMTPYVEQQDAVRGTRKKEIFDRFIEVLRENYTSQRAIGFYADRLCMTPKYLSQVVHSVSGRHAGDWIRDYVILEAKALLKPNRPVRKRAVQRTAGIRHAELRQPILLRGIFQAQCRLFSFGIP